MVMTFVSILAAMVVVLAEEPKNRNNCAAEKYKEHLGPLVASLVELCRDDLTAGDVYECSAGKAQKDDVDNGVTFRNCHADQNANGRSQGKYSQEDANLAESEARPRECATKRHGRSCLVDEDARCELPSLINAVLKPESNSFE